MKRRRDIFVLWGAAAAAAVTATSAVAAPKPVDSWGRSGVDYETYKHDSLECGLIGYYADVSGTEQAQAFVRATRQFEAIDNTTGNALDWVEHARRYETIRRSIRPEKTMDALQEGMVAVVEGCLRERGYVRFRLTDEQRETLSELDRGSDERRAYLHSLASNRAVLDAQALPPAAS